MTEVGYPYSAYMFEGTCKEVKLTSRVNTDDVVPELSHCDAPNVRRWPAPLVYPENEVDVSLVVD